MCLRPSPCIRSESLATPSSERVLLWCIAAGSPLLFSPLETKAQSPLWPEPVATEVVEGNSGWTDIQWLPKLSSSPSVSRSVYYASVDGSAIAGVDYRPVEGVLVFPGAITARASRHHRVQTIPTHEKYSCRMPLGSRC